MSASLLAEFADPDALRAALKRVGEAGHHALDAFTPFPLDGLDGLASPPSRIRPIMLACGLGTALLAYALELYSAVYAYPLNLGGRPLHSWPVFLLVPFEVGVFAAALGGVIAFLWSCRLPKLYDPLFAVPGFERATQDRFFLLTEPATADDTGANALRHLLEEAGAAVVTQVRER